MMESYAATIDTLSETMNKIFEQVSSITAATEENARGANEIAINLINLAENASDIPDGATTTDGKNKLVKAVWSGKPDVKEIEDACNKVANELSKFSKGKALLLADVRNLDNKLLPVGSEKIIQENHMFSVSHCRKIAQIVSGLMLQKSLEKILQGDKFAQFSSEQEAVKWLLS